MSMTASSFLLQRLMEWGVTRIYGYPGDGINGLLAALEKFSDKLEFIQVRHEEMAAFMACAHAKFTGEVGVCMGTSGPGAIHLLNGLYDAKMDHVPVVAIVGQAATMALGGSYQQEVDLQTLFKDVSEYNATIASPTATRHIVDRAFRVAMGLERRRDRDFSERLQEEDYAEPPRKHNTLHSGVGYSAPMVIPRLRDLQRAAEVLNNATKVAMLVGAGAKNASDEVIAIADKLQACCAKALLGKDVLPDDLPWVTGTIGLLGTRPSSDIMNECDALLMVGTNFPYCGISAERRFGAGRADRHRSALHRFALSDERESHRRRRGHACRRCCRICIRKTTPRGARASARTKKSGTPSKTTARSRAPTRSIRNCSSARSTRCCRRTRSSPAMRARRRTGWRVISWCAAA